MEEHRMRKSFRLVLWGVLILIMVFSVSCSPSPAGSAVEAESGDAELEEPTAEVAEELSGGEETEAPVEEAGTGGEEPVSENGVPTDFPVPEEAYQLQVTRGKIVSFQIDATIDEMVTYYTDNLPGAGWEMAGPQDTSVGSVASMLRKNAAGDQLSITMQGNELGGFVRVTLSVNRSG
jgi:hypothetical protein